MVEFYLQNKKNASATHELEKMLKLMRASCLWCDTPLYFQVLLVAQPLPFFCLACEPYEMFTTNMWSIFCIQSGTHGIASAELLIGDVLLVSLAYY